VQKVFSAGSGVERVYFPEKSSQVSDRPVLTLVVLAPNQSMENEDKVRQLVETMTKECGKSGRTFKSALVWCVPDSATTLHDEARKVLAWEDIEDQDHDRLDDGQNEAMILLGL